MLHFADALVNHLYRNRAELTSWMVLTEPSKEFIFEVLVTCFIIGGASIFEIGGKGISNFMGFCKAIHCYRSFSFTFKLAFPCFPEGSGIFRQVVHNLFRPRATNRSFKPFGGQTGVTTLVRRMFVKMYEDDVHSKTHG